MAALLVITSITSHGSVEMNQCLSTLSTVPHGQGQQQGNDRRAQCNTAVGCAATGWDDIVRHGQAARLTYPPGNHLSL